MRIGIDLGGTKIEGIALGEDGAELGRRRIATPKQDYAGTIQAIVEVVKHLEDLTGETGTVGVGMPGAHSPQTGLVKNANSTWLIGKPFNADLEKALDREVRCENDANCLAVSEAVDGAAAGAHLVFAVIIGTGCGAGIAVDGRAHRGQNAIAGEFGHNPLPWQDEDEYPGPECYCGQKGCIETWISGTGFQNDYQRATGDALTGPEILQRADRGEAEALAALARFEARLAKSLAQAINLLDPDVIVLGGGMSNVARIYDNVPPLLKDHVFGGEVTTPVRPAEHGDSSGVRGAAWLWPPKGDDAERAHLKTV